jgi:hypothetical protein
MVKSVNIVFLLFVSFTYTARLKLEKPIESITLESTSYTSQKISKYCNQQNCNGKCIEEVCYCKEGYIDITSIRPESLICSYKQRRLVLAFYLEFVLPGIGHIYANRIVFGIMKMILFVLLIMMIMNTSSKTNYGYVLKLTFVIILGMIHIFDVMAFLLNKYTDGYGIPLISMNVS